MLSFGEDKSHIPMCAAVLPLLYSIAVTKFTSSYVHQFVGKEIEPIDGSFQLGPGGLQ